MGKSEKQLTSKASQTQFVASVLDSKWNQSVMWHSCCFLIRSNGRRCKDSTRLSACMCQHVASSVQMFLFFSFEDQLIETDKAVWGNCSLKATALVSLQGCKDSAVVTESLSFLFLFFFFFDKVQKQYLSLFRQSPLLSCAYPVMLIHLTTDWNVCFVNQIQVKQENNLNAHSFIVWKGLCSISMFIMTNKTL